MVVSFGDGEKIRMYDDRLQHMGKRLRGHAWATLSHPRRKDTIRCLGTGHNDRIARGILYRFLTQPCSLTNGFLNRAGAVLVNHAGRPADAHTWENIMQSTRTRRLAMLTVAAYLVSGGTASAAAYPFEVATPSALTVQTEGAVTFVTGGIGDSELDAMAAAKADYNLHITNTDKAGAYTANTSLVITDRKGRDVLTATAGPLLYATLPSGSYTLHAENSGMTQTKHFAVSAKKPAEISLLWNLAE